MSSNCASSPDHYLDAIELADILGLPLRTVITRARHRPWLLPPRAILYDRELFRWRQDVVEAWLRNVGDLKCLRVPHRPISLTEAKATHLV
jgi:hypothetical protein